VKTHEINIFVIAYLVAKRFTYIPSGLFRLLGLYIPTYHLDSSVILYHPVVRYLGVLVDSKLNWNEAVEENKVNCIT